MLTQRRIWRYLLLMTFMLFCSAGISYATPEIGYFDDLEGNTIVGWAWDSNTPNTAIPVHVTVTNQETGEVVLDMDQTAAVYREDLEQNEIGNGKHGFRIRMNTDAFVDGIYLIEGWAEDQKLSNTQTYTKGEIAQPETEECDDSADAMTSLGVFRTTAYCPCYQCSEGWGRKTSTGATAKANHTIAVDPNVIPYGSKIMINGVVYTAEDRGGGVRGNHIDIFYDTHSQTRQHGSQSTEVFLIQ